MDEGITAKSPPGKTTRIRAFDIIRGIFLVMILINHIELYPSFFDFFTGRGRMFVSAAEGFFFMSGLLVGMVYRRRLYLGMTFIFKKMWRRAAELYIGSIVLTLLFTAMAVYLNHPAIKDGLPDVINWPHILTETLAMRYGFGWADFLDRFAILMLLAPFAFFLISRGWWRWLCLISFAAWLARGNNFTLSWQIIFVLGMLAGYHWAELGAKFSSLKAPTKKRLKLGLGIFTAITFVISYASVFFLSKLNQRLLGDPHSMSPWWTSLTNHLNAANQYIWLYTQKWTMGPVRIVLFIAWFIVLFWLISKYEHKITRLTRGVVELLGRNSLFVYITHAFIVFLFKLFIPSNTNIWQNFGITAAALALLIAITVGYKHMGEKISFKTLGSAARAGRLSIINARNYLH